MVEHNKMITVIMPLYNAEKFVEKAIISVIKQTYTNWELIIVDDGSTDKSYTIAQKYISDKVKLFSQTNRGACVSRNKALSLAKGEYIKFLDADDLLTVNCLEIQIEHFKELKENQIPFGNYIFIDEKDNVKYEYVFNLNDELKRDQVKFFFMHWEILISSPLHKKDMLTKIEGFDINLPRGQETDLHFRLALTNVEFVYFNTNTFCYRKHESENRISNQKNKGKIDLLKFYLDRLNKYEKLLSEKYDGLSLFYKKFFFTSKFSISRKYIADKNYIAANKILLEANSYPCKSFSFIIYFYLGKVFGYYTVETILRWKIAFKGNGNFKKNVHNLDKYI